MLEMRRVTSRTIDAVGYDAEARELHVHYSDADATYIYRGVEPEVYENLLKAESKGQYLNDAIKGHYRHTRL